MLVRVFVSDEGRHHSAADFARGASPGGELQIYTCTVHCFFPSTGSPFFPLFLLLFVPGMDATLSELSELVRQVHEAARATGTVFDVSLVAPDSRSAHYRVRNVGLYF